MHAPVKEKKILPTTSQHIAYEPTVTLDRANLIWTYVYNPTNSGCCKYMSHNIFFCDETRNYIR